MAAKFNLFTLLSYLNCLTFAFVVAQKGKQWDSLLFSNRCTQRQTFVTYTHTHTHTHTHSKANT